MRSFGGRPRFPSIWGLAMACMVASTTAAPAYAAGIQAPLHPSRDDVTISDIGVLAPASTHVLVSARTLKSLLADLRSKLDSQPTAEPTTADSSDVFNFGGEGVYAQSVGDEFSASKSSRSAASYAIAAGVAAGLIAGLDAYSSSIDSRTNWDRIVSAPGSVEGAPSIEEGPPLQTPEPGSLALLGAGIAGWLAHRRKRSSPPALRNK